ncbi:MAG TPA: prephenate dehydratase [Candidatus Goldiibacteriota bacterium]|nr:prephenate dehydratase [Candidatus Goldiibacteriota bacterium]
MKDKISGYRKRIDLIDAKLAELLHERAVNIKKIAAIKNAAGAPVYDLGREALILKKLKKGLFPEAGLRAVFNEIFSVSRAMQRKVVTAYLGPVASYSHLAGISRFGKFSEFKAEDSIRDVFLEVEKGNADYGCVPIENSTEGAVNYTYDMLADSDLKICSEIMLQINHNLLSNAASLKAVKKVYVHPQTRAQCRSWLEANLPGAELVEVSSNSKSALLAAGDKNAAGIGSELAAEEYGVKILARSIQDMADNYTRFFIIGSQINSRTGDDKTSIMVSIKDKVGALYSLLKPFQTHSVNLTNIESRPSRKKAWDYYFFVDFKGHVDDKKVKAALKEVDKNCGFVKVLGSYPRF